MIRAPLTVAIAVAATIASPAHKKNAETPVQGGTSPAETVNPLAGTQY